jgi:hypothetical protein
MQSAPFVWWADGDCPSYIFTSGSFYGEKRNTVLCAPESSVPFAVESDAFKMAKYKQVTIHGIHQATSTLR